MICALESRCSLCIYMYFDLRNACDKWAPSSLQKLKRAHFTQLCGCSCRLSRSILADKPRVTRFPVEFDPVEAVPGMPQAQASAQPEAMMGDPAQGFMTAPEMQHGAADNMTMHHLQAGMEFGQQQLTAVDMEA